MSDLSPRARALLGRVSSADGPSAQDRERVLAGLAAVLPQAAAGASATTGAAAGAKVAAIGAGPAGKLALLAVSVAIGGGLTSAGIVAHRWSSAARAPTVVTKKTPPPLPEPPAEPAAAALVPPLLSPAGHPPAAPPTPVHSQPAVHATPARLGEEDTPPSAEQGPATPPAQTTEPENPCGAELATLQRAQQLLSTEPLAAVKALDAFESACPSGPLLEERLATRALALCLGGDRASGRSAAESLAARYPSSPSLVRVGQACGVPTR